jgi:NAD(P)H-flavin reductase
LRLTTVLVATAILALATVTVVSRQRARADESAGLERSLQVAKKSKGNFVTVKVAGQDVEVDSQTGQMKELTPEEKQRLVAGLKQMVNQSTEGLVQVQHADGSVSMDLEGRFQNVAVARVNKDGSVTQSCVDNPQAGGAFFGIDPKLIEDQPNKRPNKP